MGVLKRKSIYLRKYRFSSLSQGQGSVSKVRECAQSIPRLEKSKNRRFSHKNPKMFDFRFKNSIFSLNQEQGSVFNFWECAQSIHRIKLPLKMIILEKFFHEIVPNLYPPLSFKRF